MLTNHGPLQARISAPRHKWPKEYWVQVEGDATDEALRALRQGVLLKDGMTAPAEASRLSEPEFAPRDPPIRSRASIPTSWLRLCIREGRNRQVRRMTAHVGYPTLRLVRAAVGPLRLDDLSVGAWKELPADQVATLMRWKP